MQTRPVLYLTSVISGTAERDCRSSPGQRCFPGKWSGEHQRWPCGLFSSFDAPPVRRQQLDPAGGFKAVLYSPTTVKWWAVFHSPRRSATATVLPLTWTVEPTFAKSLLA